ncbi:MAG: FtsX-like permease family protein [Acidimicrobiia bacterium]
MPSEPRGRGIGVGAMLSEGARIAWSAPVASVMVGLIVASVCAVILATTGQTVRAEQDVLARIDEAGTRSVTAVDDQGTASIPVSAVERVAELSGVEWVVGFGFAIDGRNSQLGRGGTPVATRVVWGVIPDVVAVNGRPPQPGEALVGPAAQISLGLASPVGGIDLDDQQAAVVGGFEASDPLGFLNTTILLASDPAQADAATLRSIHVLADSPDTVATLTPAIAAALGAQDPTGVRFETSETLAQLRAAVAGELGRFGRNLILATLAASLVLTALVVYGSVTLRRQDFGRRRALGAGRTTITGLVAVQYSVVGLLGAVLGSIAGSVTVYRLTDGFPDLRFTVAIAVLAVLATIGASIPPAVIAAFRDPVRVLRVP